MRWSDEDLKAYQERRRGETTRDLIRPATRATFPKGEGKEETTGDSLRRFAPPLEAKRVLQGSEREDFGGGMATEDEEQIMLFEWAAMMAGKWPELKWMYHIPNGGSRNGAEAGKLRAMGVKSGVPDVALDVARGGWHGLRIEMKRADGGRTSEAQREWIEHLNAEGYRAVVCAGWQTAARVIEEYLKDAVMPME